ncbi:MAG: threonylcarbamoyl-AMP synthase [Bacteroidales bacterium]|nr:threonylcarbamoyl-AMP synthase [Bacteroidales bacterium]
MENEIKNSLEVLRNGGIILYPTDTIWGLGCDATNEEACKKLNSLKHRDSSKPMIILVDSIAMIDAYTEIFPDIIYELIEFSDTPLTIVFPEGRNLPKSVMADDGSIGIRLVKHKFCKELIRKLRNPIISTSANLSEHYTPKAFSEISDEIKQMADYIVNYEQNSKNKKLASKIVKFNKDGSFKVLR